MLNYIDKIALQIARDSKKEETKRARELRKKYNRQDVRTFKEWQKKLYTLSQS